VASSSFESHWRGLEGIFGGYVLARFADAARCIPGFVPISLTIQFVSAVDAGDGELTTEIMHQGVQTAGLRMQLHQEGRLRAHALAVLVPVGRTVAWGRRRDLSLVPPPEECVPHLSPVPRMSYADNLEILSCGAPTLEGGAAAWIRLREGVGELDLGGAQSTACVFLDSLPPGLYAEPPLPSFVPTIDFSAHFSPSLSNFAGEWHYAINETVWSDDRYCVEESTLCLPDGLIVAQVRQSRAIRWPQSDPSQKRV